MKRQDAFDKMRANRKATEVAEMRRINEVRRVEHEASMSEYAEQDRKFKEQQARFKDFETESSLILQMTCIPFMTPEYYAGMREKMDRLCNEHGVSRGKKPKLQAV